jgi:ABC-2 type transport system permease protein
MRAFLALVRAETVLFLRDKLALFLVFLFPLVFILIFGFLMGGTSGPQATRIGVAVAAGADSSALESVLANERSIRVLDYADASALERAVTERAVDFGLVWDGKALVFAYDPSRVQENYGFQQLAQGLATDFNLRRQGVSPVLSAEKVDLGKTKTASSLSLLVPGILAFAVLSAGLFAVSGHLTAMKERKILDRFLVTPMRPVLFLGAIVVVRLVVVYVSTLITLVVSMTVFKVKFDVDWIRYTLFVASSTLGMMGFGTLIVLVVRRSASAGNLANILSMAMMFLSGIYFPIELMPSFLRAVSRALPLTYMAEGMRYTTGVAEISGLRFWVVTAVFLGMAAVLLPILARYVVAPERR